MRYKLPAYAKPADLLFETGSGFFSWAIRKVTDSNFAHVALVIDRNTVIEAWPGGVREIPCPYRPGTYQIKTYPYLSEKDRKQIITYARRLKGTPYDYKRILALWLELALHIKNRIYSKGKIICSSYAALSYLEGAHLRLRTDKAIYHLTPEDLVESPLLVDPFKHNPAVISPSRK